MTLSSLYYTQFAAAYVRGMVKQTKAPILSRTLLEKSLAELSGEETEEIITAGKEAGLKLHAFKRTHGDLPRVKRVLGFLKSVAVTSLLDIGSGRGTFLWPCLYALPELDICCLDILPHRVDALNTVRLGGLAEISAKKGDICSPHSLEDKSFDVVTMLEVLEHIPDPAGAVVQAVRLAKRYIAVSVPSKPDNNPEHRHLLTKDILTGIFQRAGCTRLHFDGVSGHLILIVTLEG